ncbi:MAG: energy transducer TonB [Spirochaetota bacterium]
MPRSVAAILRYLPVPEAVPEQKAATLPAKPRVGGAFAVSLAIHILPVLALAIGPQLTNEKPADKPVVLYSVQLEKKRAVVMPNATMRKDAPQSSSRRSGNAEMDLTGEQRVQKVNYEMLLASRIERQRYYPQRARQLRQEGQPVVRMVIDTMGNITHLAIENTSGVSLLDETALDIVRRAQPFPAPPAEYSEVLRKRGDNRMIFRAPIRFTLASAG